VGSQGKPGAGAITKEDSIRTRNASGKGMAVSVKKKKVTIVARVSMGKNRTEFPNWHTTKSRVGDLGGWKGNLGKDAI